MRISEETELTLLRAAIFLAPFRALHLPGIYLTASDAMFAVALIARLSRAVPLAPFGPATNLWMLGLVMLGGGLMLGSIVNGDAQRGVIVTAQYYFAFFFIPLAIMRRSHEVAMSLVRTAGWSILVLCLIGLIAFLLDYRDPSRSQFGLVTGNGRTTSLSVNANGLASQIALYVPVVLALILTGAARLWAGALALAILLITLITTSSNSGLLATTVAIAIFVLAISSLRVLLRVSVLATVALAVIVLWGEHFLPAIFIERVFSALVSGEVASAGTFDERFELMKEALSLIEHNWLIGMGADQYRQHSHHDLPVHNTYLLLFNEGGLIAFVGLFCILLAGAFAAFLSRAKKHRSVLFGATLGSLGALMVVMVAYTHVYQRNLLVPILVLLTVALAHQSSRAARGEAALEAAAAALPKRRRRAVGWARRGAQI